MSERWSTALPAHLFGRHVADGAHDDAGLGAGDASAVGLGLERPPSSRQLGETEVEDLHAAVAREEEFSGFRSRWTMPFSCAAARPAAICMRVVDRLARRQRRRAHPRAQRLALEQLRNDVRRALVRADVEDREDVRMVQRAGRCAPPARSGAADRGLGEGGRQDLDRDLALQPRVARTIHLAHPTCAKKRQDLVGSEAGASRECYRITAARILCRAESPGSAAGNRVGSAFAVGRACVPSWPGRRRPQRSASRDRPAAPGWASPLLSFETFPSAILIPRDFDDGSEGGSHGFAPWAPEPVLADAPRRDGVPPNAEGGAADAFHVGETNPLFQETRLYLSLGTGSGGERRGRAPRVRARNYFLGALSAVIMTASV